MRNKKQYVVNIVNRNKTPVMVMGYTVHVVDRRTSLGNPFKMKDYGNDRDLVCDLYEEWFMGEDFPGDALVYAMTLLDYLREYGSINLGCWCVPERCHAETIRNWLLSEVQG